MAVVKTTVYANDADLRALKRLARERGTSSAHLIREAISKLAREGERPRPRSLGSFHGRGKVASHVDALLAEGFGRDGIDR